MNNSQRITRAASCLAMPGVAFLCLAIGAWWLAKPYRAFEHDAVYYMAEALARAGWADFSKDLFFRYGSQGEFSPLVGPYALLVKTLGVHASAWGVTVVGKLAWLAAGWCLVRALAPTRAQACIALATVLILPSFYPLADIFNYGESFATPRLVSEAAALAGLAALVSGRWWPGMVLAAFSLIAHPLMGAPACAVALMMSPAARPDLGPSGVSWRRVAIVLVAGVVLMLVGAQLGVRPLDRLWQHYDQAWWDVMLVRNDYAISQTWTATGLAQLAMQGAFLGLAALANPPRSIVRQLGVVMLVVSVACLSAWLWGCATRNVLLIQVQPWRVLWLAQWLTPVLWVAAFFAAPRAWQASDQALAALVAAGLVASPLGMVVLAVLVGVLVWRPAQVAQYVPVHLQRALACLILALVLVLRLILLPDLAMIAKMTTNTLYPWCQAVANEPAVGIAVGWACLSLWSRWRPSARIVQISSVGTMALAVLCFAVWLQEGWRWVQAEAPWAAELRQRLPADSVVYSTEQFSTLWLDLRRPLYADTSQGASTLFNREQALELNRRLLRLHDLGLSDWPANPRGEAPPRHLDAATIRALCQEPEIDVVLTRGDWPSASYHVSTPVGGALAVFECRHAKRQDQQEGVRP